MNKFNISALLVIFTTACGPTVIVNNNVVPDTGSTPVDTGSTDTEVAVVQDSGPEAAQDAQETALKDSATIDTGVVDSKVTEVGETGPIQPPVKPVSNVTPWKEDPTHPGDPRYTLDPMNFGSKVCPAFTASDFAGNTTLPAKVANACTASGILGQIGSSQRCEAAINPAVQCDKCEIDAKIITPINVKYNNQIKTLYWYNPVADRAASNSCTQIVWNGYHTCPQEACVDVTPYIYNPNPVIGNTCGNQRSPQQALDVCIQAVSTTPDGVCYKAYQAAQIALYNIGVTIDLNTNWSTHTTLVGEFCH